MDSWTHAYRTTWENVPRASLGTSGGSLVLPTSLPFHVATRYRDPSLGVARLRVRLRCLRMTINRCRGLDSGSRNDFFGEVRGPILGEGEQYSGISGSQGSWGVVKVWSLRGLGRICGFCGTA